MDGTTAFLNWTATTRFTSPDTSNNHLPPLTFKGVAKAIFSPASNKLLSTDLTFDAAIINNQIQHIQSLTHVVFVDQGTATAAAEADAILDSLEMPYFLPSVIGNNTSSTAITTTNNDHIASNMPAVASITSSEKSESENEDDIMQNDTTMI